MFPRILAGLLLLVPLHLPANETEILSYASLPGRIRASNPDLAAARLRIREALGRKKQAGRPANPELETEFEHDSRFREGRIEIGISQRFPVTNRLQLEKQVSLAAVEAAEAEVREVERKLVAEAREAFVRVLAIRSRRELLREQEALSGKLADFISAAAEKGEGSPLDAGQARLEAARMATEARKLDAEEAAATGELKPLLGLPTSAGLHLSGALGDPALPAGGKAIKRPDLDAARLDAQAASGEIAVEQSKRREDVEAGVFAAAERTEDAPEGLDTEAIVGLRFKLPLPFWNKNEGAIDEAIARSERKEKEADALAQNIRHEATTARAEMEQWAAMIGELDSKLLPLAKTQSEQTETAWRNGQGELQTVLKAREQSLELRAARLDALREFHLARVRYEAATGNP
jgi:cobalt-zinc-cadmium efflux system outer membrane protein